MYSSWMAFRSVLKAATLHACFYNSSISNSDAETMWQSERYHSEWWRYTPSSPEPAATISFTELYCQLSSFFSNPAITWFWLFRFTLTALSAVFWHCTPQHVFKSKAHTDSWWLVGELIAAKEPDIPARSWYRAKTELKRDWILELHSPSGQKHNCKWMLMLLYSCWMCKIQLLANKFSISSYKVMIYHVYMLFSQLVSAALKWPKTNSLRYCTLDLHWEKSSDSEKVLFNVWNK